MKIRNFIGILFFLNQAYGYETAINIGEIRSLDKPSYSHSKIVEFLNKYNSDEIIGTDTCLTIDKISHTYGQHWQASDPNWTVVSDKPNSTSIFLQSTMIKQTTEAYHATLFENSSSVLVADVLCSYGDEDVILKRSYTTQECSLIEGKNQDGSTGVGIFWTFDTHCSTTAGKLQVCQYNLIRSHRDYLFQLSPFGAIPPMLPI